jgi:DNA topoisomerase-1
MYCLSNVTRPSLYCLYCLYCQVGIHPDSGEAIQSNNGRFGPYLRHKSLYVTLPQGLGPQEVTLEEALQLIAAKEDRLRARGRDPYEVVGSGTEQQYSSTTSSTAVQPAVTQCFCG